MHAIGNTVAVCQVNLTRQGNEQQLVDACALHASGVVGYGLESA